MARVKYNNVIEELHGATSPEYIDALNREIQKFLPDYSYKKNDKTTYSILCQYGHLDLAIRYAERLEALYNDSNYAMHKPCTKVHHLVQELLNPEEILNIFA